MGNPPNGHGMVTLMALNIYKKLSKPEWESTQTIHEQIESMKLAFIDGKAFITEEADMPVETAHLLSDEYAAKRVLLIEDEAMDPQPYELPKGVPCILLRQMKRATWSPSFNPTTWDLVQVLLFLEQGLHFKIEDMIFRSTKTTRTSLDQVNDHITQLFLASSQKTEKRLVHLG